MVDERDVTKWIMKDDVLELDIIPAKYIYRIDFNRVIWRIRDAFWMWRKVMYQDYGSELRIQAWQYVKAYSKILKDRGHFDHDRGIPIEAEWMKLRPESRDWMCYYMRNPAHQTDMNEYYKYWLANHKPKRRRDATNSN